VSGHRVRVLGQGAQGTLIVCLWVCVFVFVVGRVGVCHGCLEARVLSISM
jgi:hypothetical protein